MIDVKGQINSSSPMLNARADFDPALEMASRPSRNQRARACHALLKDVENLFDNINAIFRAAQKQPGGIEELARDPDYRRLMTNWITELKAKIETIKSQCGDLLPKKELQRVEELERRLGALEREARGEGAHFGIQVNWNRVAQGLSNLAGGVAAGALSAIGWALQRIFNPANAH